MVWEFINKYCKKNKKSELVRKVAQSLQNQFGKDCEYPELLIEYTEEIIKIIKKNE